MTNSFEWHGFYVTKSSSLIKNSKQHSSPGGGRKASSTTEVRDCLPPACVELGLVSPEGPELLSSAFHLQSYSTMLPYSFGRTMTQTNRSPLTTKDSNTCVHLSC